MITFSQICRLCINKTHSDYTIQFVDEDSVTLGDKIKIVCDIQINQSDCLPMSICELCLGKLRQFYDFKLSCLQSSRRLSQFKKQLLSSSSKDEKSQTISVRSMKELTQNTHLILNCINNKLENVTSVQQHHSVQDHSLQLVNISLPETDNSAAQLSDNDDVASYNNDDDNADTMSYDDYTNTEDVKHSVTDNSVKQITNEDPLLLDGVTVNTVKVECKTEEKFAHVDVEMYVEKVEDKWMKWENEEESETVESAKTVDSSMEDSKDHIANEEDSEDRSPVTDDISDADSYFCHTCNKHFTNKSAISSHQRYHAQHEANYQCDRCDKQFKLKSSHQKHMRRHSGKRPYKCDQCDKTFTDKVYLNSHSKMHSDARPYQCEICGKTFKFSSARRVHMTTHSDAKPFECSTCGKAFSVKDALNVHMRTHTGLRPFKCTTCDKCFLDRWTLKKHSIVHTTERKYRCDICQMSFKQSQCLKGHKRLHSRDPDKIKLCNFACEVCGKMLRTRNSLMKHAAVHGDGRPFKCPLCGQCFAERSSLRSHKLVHTNIEEHKCEYCEQEFKNKSKMLIHITRKHSNLITDKDNISLETDEHTTNDSTMVDNEEEKSESMMVDNEEETNGTKTGTYS